LRTYVFSPSAREDLASISEYIQDAAGSEIAQKMIQQLRSKCEMLAETPGELGTIRSELADRLRSFYVRPFVLFFRSTESTVEIIRVLRERQDVDRAFS
jgi:toxin ParE1/3/4